MAQEHQEDARNARRVLVELRRAHAKVLAHRDSINRQNMSDAIRGIVDVQHAVEAIDRAILDEGDLFSKGQ